MAMKRCPDCGEKYSDSYKYCPFCEEEEILREGKGRGGRRAKQSRRFSLLTPILVVLILLMAGLLIYLLRGDKQPSGGQTPVTPQPSVVTPVQPGSDTENPDDTQAPDDTENPDDTNTPGVVPEEPDDSNGTNSSDTSSTTPSTPTTPSTTGTGAATVVNAAGGVFVRSGAGTSYEALASLKNGDKVTVVSSAGDGWYQITFSGSGGSAVTGYMKGDFLSTTAGSSTGSTTTTTTTTNTGSSTGTTGTSSGSLKAGAAVVTNAGGGVFVRSGAGTTYESLASLSNGNEVQIVESAGSGWYKITFKGTGGKTVTGYMKGDYLKNS